MNRNRYSPYSSSRRTVKSCEQTANAFDPTVDFSIFYTDSSVKPCSSFRLSEIDNAHYNCDKANSPQRSELKLAKKFTGEDPIKYVHRGIFILDDPPSLSTPDSVKNKSILYAPKSIIIHKNFLKPEENKITLDPNSIERGLRPRVTFRSPYLQSLTYNFDDHITRMALHEHFPPIPQPHPTPSSVVVHDVEMSNQNLSDYPPVVRDLLLSKPMVPTTANQPSTPTHRQPYHSPAAAYEDSDSDDSQVTLPLSPVNHRDQQLLLSIDTDVCSTFQSSSLLSMDHTNYIIKVHNRDSAVIMFLGNPPSPMPKVISR